jgi:hypothetical protein
VRARSLRTQQRAESQCQQTPSAGAEGGRRPTSIPWRIPLVHDEHTARRDQRSLRRHTGPSWTARQPYKAFTESLILAQDERWRRA